jgi:hypothetical protein
MMSSIILSTSVQKPSWQIIRNNESCRKAFLRQWELRKMGLALESIDVGN